jgi:hypothetical protein
MKKLFMFKRCYLAALLIILLPQIGRGQQPDVKWLTVGSLQSFFNNYGCEREEDRPGSNQQDGIQWPALYTYQDMAAARGLWIGTTTDPYGVYSTPKVVHFGPRPVSTEALEFFPVKFEMVSKIDPPMAFVNSNQTYHQFVDNDRVDANLKADRMIDVIVNTSIGITMERKVYAFSQQSHDNYFIYDYTFTNTGRTGKDTTTRAAGFPKTLKDVYFYYQYRTAVCYDIRGGDYGDPPAWGKNAMLDVRGDTSTYSPASPYYAPWVNKDNDLRVQYTWLGKVNTTFDNIGGPIWKPTRTSTSTKGDTIGRLGAAQFHGILTMHVDKSPTDTTDDKGQPSTTSFESSDDNLNFRNIQTNSVQMSSEYDWMKKGHVFPRHAEKVGFGQDPSLGTTGGWSNANGYGPYTLAPWQSIHIVMAEAAAGISREACVEIGKQFKRSNGSTTLQIPWQGKSLTKNEWVFSGRDSLFSTLRRAYANYGSGYNIPQAPYPPRAFNVFSGAGAIRMNWTHTSGGPTRTGYQIWRAMGQVDSTYYLVASLPATATSFDDTSASNDVGYCYYISAIGDPAQNTRTAGTISGALMSNRFYTQTFELAYKRVAASPVLKGDSIRIVPNPYVISAKSGLFLYPGEANKIVFKNIPAICTIRIYSELGELIKTIEHTDMTASQDWFQTTSSDQIIVSGVYIAVISTPSGEKAIKKFIVIR